MLTREQILARGNDLPRESLEVPGLGTMWFRSMTTTERQRFARDHEEKKEDGYVERFIAATACTEDGALLFTTDDLEAIGKLPAAMTDVMVKESMRINGMDTEALDVAKKDSPMTLS